MQYAKKLALVDPKILDQLQVDRECKAIPRPAPAVAMTSLSLDISRILNDETIPDLEKVKLYGNALRRYVNIRNEIPARATDELTGTEFLNSTFQSILRRYDVKFYTSENEDIKAAVVERFNRTLKQKMYRYFTAKRTRRYIHRRSTRSRTLLQ